MVGMTAATALRFTKGHGTENDFVLVPDPEGELVLDPARVRALTDRRAGIGADGVIRVVPTSLAAEPEVRAQAGEAAWFMDYRNADGSIAQMCGNGTRVFAAYLRREGLESADSFAIATRAGVRQVNATPQGYAVDLGRARVDESDDARRTGFNAVVHSHGGPELPGLRVDVGNPHTVVVLPPGTALDTLDLGVVPHRPRRRAQTSSSSTSWGPGTSPCGSTNAAWGRPARAAPGPWPPPSRPGGGRAPTRATAGGSSTSRAGGSPSPTPSRAPPCSPARPSSSPTGSASSDLHLGEARVSARRGASGFSRGPRAPGSPCRS